MKRFYLGIILSIVAISFFACKDDPSSLGSKLIPPTDLVKFDTLNTGVTPIPQNTSSYFDTLNLGPAARVLLGKNGDLESSVLMRFFILLPDSVFLPLQNDSIIVRKAWVNMIPNYRLGDKSAAFDFTVREIKEDWLPNNFDKDSLNNLNIGIEEISPSKTITDTLITFDVDSSLVLNWFKFKVDSINFKNHFGFYLKADPSTSKILGFQAISTSLITRIPELFYIVEKPGEFIDTLNAFMNADVHVIEGTKPLPAANEIVLQGGFGTRGKLFFDISSIIPKKAILNSAILELTPDDFNSILSEPSPDSISVTMFSSDTTKNEIASQFGTIILEKDSSKYQGLITPFLQLWINGTDNTGLRLLLTDELNTLGKVAIYGSGADINLRPKLIVTYSTQ